MCLCAAQRHAFLRKTARDRNEQSALRACAQVFALGFVSVFDQVLEGLPDNDRENLFKAYIECLDEDASKYRQVSASLQSCAVMYPLVSAIAATFGPGDWQQAVLPEL